MIERLINDVFNQATLFTEHTKSNIFDSFIEILCNQSEKQIKVIEKKLSKKKHTQQQQRHNSIHNNKWE